MVRFPGGRLSSGASVAHSHTDANPRGVGLNVRYSAVHEETCRLSAASTSRFERRLNKR